MLIQVRGEKVDRDERSEVMRLTVPRKGDVVKAVHCYG